MIASPDDSTIVFNLTSATGDFPKRMAMPATGPMPDEVTKCFEGQPGKYAADLISTAGYMYKGLDSVDVLEDQAGDHGVERCRDERQSGGISLAVDRRTGPLARRHELRPRGVDADDALGADAGRQP